MTGRTARLLCGRRGKWLVLGMWAVVVAVIGPFAAQLSGVQKNELSDYLPADADSARAVHRIVDMQGEDFSPVTIVYEHLTGMTPADRKKIKTDLEAVSEVGGVVTELPPPKGKTRTVDTQTFKKELNARRDNGRLPAELRPVAKKFKPPPPMPEDGPIKIVQVAPAQNGTAVSVSMMIGEMSPAATAGTVDVIREIVSEGMPDGLNGYVTGTAGYAADALQIFGSIDGALIFVALGVAVLVLLITYRGVVLWAVPVGVVIVGLTVALGVNVFLARGDVITVGGVAASLLMVLVVGAGTDYALLLVARYREELMRRADRHEAMAIALRRAGPAIMASGGTVIAALLCLLVAELNSTRGLGPASAIGVACAMAAMLTLLPALLVIFGRWIFWPVIPSFRRHGGAAGEGRWHRLGAAISQSPRLVWLVTALVLAGLIFGLGDFREGGLADRDAFTTVPESVLGDEVFQEHFSKGPEQPVQVVTTEERAESVIIDLAKRDEVAEISLAGAGGGDVLVAVTLDSGGARDDVIRLRDRLFAIGAPAHGGDPGTNVGGTAALTTDVQRAAERDRLVIIPLVLLVIFLILAVLLRALVAPFLALATVVLSFAATMGLSAFVFAGLLGFPAVDQGFVLTVFIFLVALGVDYNIFLMYRIREESYRLGTRRGAIAGLSATGGVITSAGVVLAGTFGALAVLPMSQTVQIAFAVATGVLLDTFVVRSILVTALTLDMGDAVWWPGSYSRRRYVRVEGSQLGR